MCSIKELLGNNERVWFDINQADYTSFLTYALDQGCTWMDGSTIKPDKDNCSHHMGINNELKLGFVSMGCWYSGASNTPSIVPFDKMKKENL